MKILFKWLGLQLLVLINWLIPHPLPTESMFFTGVCTVYTEASGQGYILRPKSPAIKFNRAKPAGEQLL